MAAKSQLGERCKVQKTLFIDGGNTSAKWCVCGNEAWETENEGFLTYDAGITELVQWSDITKVYIADVSNYLVPIVKAMVSSGVTVTEVVSVDELLGVSNRYSEPQRLGVDRFLSALKLIIGITSPAALLI